MPPSNQCTAALKDFFDRKLEKLPQDYDWPIPHLELPVPPSQSRKRGYQPNVDLKKHLHTRWKKGRLLEQYGIALFVVDCWGGVQTNRTSKIIQYVDEIVGGNFDNPFKGIASYSKIRAIEDPNQFAIFDARVGAALNAVQWNAGLRTSGLAFHYPPGRNNITGNRTTESGFAYHEQFSTSALIQAGWQEVPEEETYVEYLKTLSACAQFYEKYALYDLEMALFANAERECSTAMSGVDGTPAVPPTAEADSRSSGNRRPKMNFSRMGIPVGSVLQYARGNVHVTVVSERKVRWNSSDLSLYAVTKHLTGLERPGQPSNYWTFEGEKLRTIYDRTYPR